mmetsp:Transcript_685/g.2509  ORF Transcript_685/g.2509 Transcript_685/m.2509 type:complete len:221 (-) Transcript_685:1840-2502(-)
MRCRRPRCSACPWPNSRARGARSRRPTAWGRRRGAPSSRCPRPTCSAKASPSWRRTCRRWSSTTRRASSWGCGGRARASRSWWTTSHFSSRSCTAARGCSSRWTPACRSSTRVRGRALSWGVCCNHLHASDGGAAPRACVRADVLVRVAAAGGRECAGFGALMITTVVSYRSHSQVWALEDAAEGGLLVGGRTNRATLTFLDELRSAVAEAEAEAEAKSS